MTIVNIQRDGSVYPPLKPDSLLIKILNGNLEIGKYEKESYTKYNFITGQCVLAEIMCDGLV